MKHPRFHISLYVIIPVIFGGFAVLSAIVSFRLTEYSLKQGFDSTWSVFLAAIIIGGLSFLCALTIIRLILKPVEKFLEEAKQSPAISTAGEKNNMNTRMDQLEEFTQVFDQVTSVLSRLDARHFFPEIAGESKVIRGVMSQIMKVAPTNSTVLIFGESGTGKEMVATGIYKHSLRNAKPFIKLNCVAIPEGLFESELFGHEKGAFTGSTSTKPGKFEMANGGTIFLDEIGDMPFSVQAKILRVLQEREFDRVGGTKTIKVDIRIIAATNKDLAKMVQEGKFREDLLFRLNVISLNLPPLRERRGDIPLLIDHFLQKMSKTSQISSMALQLFLSYSWPGNIRELQNVIERATVLSENGVIDTKNLPGKITGQILSKDILLLPENASIDDKLREMDKMMTVEALHRAEGVQVKAAKLLGIKERSLWHRIKKYNIDVETLKMDVK